MRCSLFAGGDLSHFAGEDLMHVGSFVCSEVESQGSSEPSSQGYGVNTLSRYSLCKQLWSFNCVFPMQRLFTLQPQFMGVCHAL